MRPRKRACAMLGIDCLGRGWHRLNTQAWPPSTPTPPPEVQERMREQIRAPCICLAGDEWIHRHVAASTHLP